MKYGKLRINKIRMTKDERQFSFMYGDETDSTKFFYLFIYPFIYPLKKIDNTKQKKRVQHHTDISIDFGHIIKKILNLQTIKYK